MSPPHLHERQSTQSIFKIELSLLPNNFTPLKRSIGSKWILKMSLQYCNLNSTTMSTWSLPQTKVPRSQINHINMYTKYIPRGPNSPATTCRNHNNLPRLLMKQDWLNSDFKVWFFVGDPVSGFTKFFLHIFYFSLSIFIKAHEKADFVTLLIYGNLKFQIFNYFQLFMNSFTSEKKCVCYIWMFCKLLSSFFVSNSFKHIIKV